MRHTCKGEFGSQAGMESVDVVQSVRISFEASSAPLEKIRFALPLHIVHQQWNAERRLESITILSNEGQS